MTAPVMHSDVLQTLGSEIVDGRPAPGEALTLAQLASRFDMSRTVIREAVRVLESLGLVVSKRRVGVVVRPLSEWAVLDPRVIAWRLACDERAAQLRSLTQLRHAIEPSAARVAAQGSGRGQAAELLRLAELMRGLGERGEGDTAAYLEADVDFHTLLLRASGNEMFAALESTIAEVLRGRTRIGETPPWPAPHSLTNHEEIARAIFEGRAEAAEAAARDVVGEVLLELEDPARRPGSAAGL